MEDLKIHNPLSTEQSSVWTERFADHELAQTIRHDLLRTHAEISLFTRPRTQALMFNVLFAWAKEEGTEDKGRYRQGMNELLAPIVLVLTREAQTRDGWTHNLHSGSSSHTSPSAAGAGTGKAAESTSPSASSSSSAFPAAAALDSLLPTLLDPAYVEHDVYALLVRVLHFMGVFFARVDPAANARALAAKKKARALAGGGGASISAAAADAEVEQTPMVKKTHYIHHILLSTLDPLLYTHLNRNEVSPQLYLLRWVRQQHHLTCMKRSTP